MMEAHRFSLGIADFFYKRHGKAHSNYYEVAQSRMLRKERSKLTWEETGKCTGPPNPFLSDPVKECVDIIKSWVTSDLAK